MTHPGGVRVAERGVRVLLVAVAALSVAACSLHLHSPENARRARAALQTYEQLRVDSVVTTGRSNMAELSRAQLETRQRVSEVLTKVDLANVIGPEPDGPGERGTDVFGPGWGDLVAETHAVLGRYDLLTDTGAYTEAGLIASRAIRHRAANTLQLSNNRQIYRAFVEDYQAANPAAGTQDTRCPAVLARVPGDTTVPPVPAGEPPRKWEHYTRFIAPLCRRLEQQEGVLREADGALRKDSEYQALAGQIATLESELAQSEAAARDLLQQYEAAKKRLAEAEREAARRTVAQQTAAVKAEVEAAQAKLDAALKDIETLVEGSQKFGELLQVQIKTDLLETILTQARALGGDPDAAAARPTQQLLAAVRKYPDIAGRLRAAQVPPVNVLLLELAVQRLHYRRLQAGRDAKRDILTILRRQADAHADRAAAWIRVMDNVVLAREASVDLRALPVEAFASATPIGRQRIAEALIAYAVAKQSSEYTLNALNAQLRDRYRAQSLELTEIAVGTWNDLIRAPLAEIVAYHEGGITSEELARLVNALGIMAIAVGVYQ
jgi:hypothetical protein